jgi:hypothetical protein
VAIKKWAAIKIHQDPKMDIHQHQPINGAYPNRAFYTARGSSKVTSPSPLSSQGVMIMMMMMVVVMMMMMIKLS